MSDYNESEWTDWIPHDPSKGRPAELTDDNEEVRVKTSTGECAYGQDYVRRWAWKNYKLTAYKRRKSAIQAQESKDLLEGWKNWPVVAQEAEQDTAEWTGWIPHDGYTMPIELGDGNGPVHVKYRDGAEGFLDFANSWRWPWAHRHTDIIAYKRKSALAKPISELGAVADDEPETADIDDGGPAFPTKPEIRQQVTETIVKVIAGDQPGMTLRQYAAIKLKVPKSGTPWIDAMILEAKRDDLAKSAMQSLINVIHESHASVGSDAGMTAVANTAHRIADAMIACGMSDAALAAILAARGAQ